LLNAITFAPGIAEKTIIRLPGLPCNGLVNPEISIYFWTACFSLCHSATKYLLQTSRQTVAASLLLVSDQTLARLLDLRTMLSIHSRFTSIFRLQPLSEDETQLFINSRLRNAQAPEDLFNKKTIEVIAAPPIHVATAGPS